MKKLLLAGSLLLFCSFVNAQELTTPAINADVNQILMTQPKPSDGEIMQVIESFNFTGEQKQTLFNETKKRIDEMYAQQGGSSPEAQQGQPKQGGSSAAPKREKKYSKHGTLGPRG